MLGMRLILSKVFDKFHLLFYKPLWFFKNFLILKIANISYEQLPSIEGVIIVKNRGYISFGKGVKINSNRYGNPVGNSQKATFFCSPKGEIIIKENVSMSRVLLFSQVRITIEENVMLGGGVQVWDSNFHSINFIDRVLNGDSDIQSKEVIIKKGVFIGADSIILKGVTIGERSVVAAGSIVSKDIPEDELWGGNPANFIRKIN